MGIIINDNLAVNAGKPLDSKYANVTIPWVSVAEVNANIPQSYRYVGLTVNINNAEYWYRYGITDLDLVEKSGVGTVDDANNGIRIVNSGTRVTLGGSLTGDTVFDGGASNFTLQYGDNYHSNFVNRTLVDKEYVDIIATGIKPKAAVKVATTENIVLSGLTIVDNYQLLNADRVLVKDQLSGEINGIYSASTGNWGRTSDFNGNPSGEIQTGTYMFVLSGDTNRKTAWILTTEDPIVIGVTPLSFAVFNHVQDVVAGVGITISANTMGHVVSFDGANVVGSCLSWNGSQLNLDGTSQSIINNSLTGASNGLSVSNNIVRLGGNLESGCTIVTLPYASQTAFVVGQGDVNWNGGRLELCRDNLDSTKNCAFIGARTDSNNYSYIRTCATSGISICSHINSVHYGLRLSDNALTYDSCYHSGYTNRTLVDKEYVDNSSGGICAGNGLTRTSGMIILGGALTGNTSISGNGHDLTLGASLQRLDNLRTNVSGTTTINSGYLTIYSSGATFSDLSINPAGIQYGACYHNTYTNRSLIDKEYYSLSLPVTNAANGLCISNKNVVLGGTLTGTTTIDLNSNVFNLKSDSVNKYGYVEFGLNATYANSKFGICSRDGSGGIWGVSGNSSNISMLHCSNTTNGTSMCIGNSDISLSSKISSAVKTISLAGNALVYGSDYCLDYVDRTLVDKGYVDGKICRCSNVLNVCNVGTVYTTTIHDDYVGVSGTNCIYLYTTPAIGQRVIVADICGNGQFDPITVDGNGICINGGSVSTINTDYGSITYLYNGLFWNAIGFVN